jgi:hypothetical protein
MFPRDTLSLIVDNPNNNTVLLTASTSPLTILMTRLSCQSAGGDVHLKIGSSTSTNYLLDYEDPLTHYQQDFQNYVLASNTSIVYGETLVSHCFITIMYVNRDRRVTFDPALASSTVSTSTGYSIGTTTVNYVPEMTTESYIYMILAVVGLLLYIFKK